jgi:hypothetical protein
MSITFNSVATTLLRPIILAMALVFFSPVFGMIGAAVDFQTPSDAHSVVDLVKISALEDASSILGTF